MSQDSKGIQLNRYLIELRKDGGSSEDSSEESFALLEAFLAGHTDVVVAALEVS